MPEKPKPRFVKNPKSIAEALGCKPTREQLRFIREWMRWEDFPKKQKHGFEIEALRGWAEKNAQKIAKFKKLGKFLQAEEDVSMGDVKLLQQPTSTGAVAGPLADLNREELLVNCETQSSLARTLEAYYKGKLTILINPQLLQAWREGKRLPPNTPTPPPKMGNSNYWSAREWVAWMERFIVPHYLPGKVSPQGEFISTAEVEAMRLADEVETLRHAKLMRDIEMGKYVEKSILSRVAEGAGRAISAELSKTERVLPLKLAAALNELQLPEEQRLTVLERFRAACEAWNETLQSTIPDALRAVVNLSVEEPKHG